jgi:polysaccharide pyruvyl transferase WcaK-like protein
LKSLPITQTDDVYPDLAFSYSPAGSLSMKPAPLRERLDFQPKSIVGISPIAYLSTHGWPVSNPPVYERYIGALVAFMKELIEQGYAIRLFATDSPDYLAIEDIMEHFHNTPLANRISQPRLTTVDDLMRFLPTVDYVVASRLHGTILSHLMNRPVLAISYDTKVDVHMDEMGQGCYRVDIHGITAETLSESFAALVDHAKAVKQSLQKTTQEYGALLSRQYDFVLQKAWSGARWPSPRTSPAESRRLSSNA